MASVHVRACTIDMIVFFDRILADERSEQAKFKRAVRAQHVLRCKLGADTQCWLLLGENFCGIKGNAKNFPPVLRFGRPDACDDIVWAYRAPADLFQRKYAGV